MLEQHRPSLDHLLNLSLGERIGQGVAGRKKAQSLAGIL